MKKTYTKILISAFIIFVFVCFTMYFNHLYPIKYTSEVKSSAAEFNLSEPLVLSLINSESGFKKDAVSKSHAVGLMQITFSTAQEIASKLGKNDFSYDDLFEPATNIRFGCFYLRFLLDYYNQNLHNALCAYNAGLSRVNSWLSDEKYSLDRVNLISVPYTETKDYVGRIYSGINVYKIIY